MGLARRADEASLESPFEALPSTCKLTSLRPKRWRSLAGGFLIVFRSSLFSFCPIGPKALAEAVAWCFGGAKRPRGLHVGSLRGVGFQNGRSSDSASADFCSSGLRISFPALSGTRRDEHSLRMPENENVERSGTVRVALRVPANLLNERAVCFSTISLVGRWASSSSLGCLPCLTWT